MKRLENCPLCGGELVHKQVAEIVSGGGHTATLMVEADVCTRCGDRLYSLETVRKLEEIQGKLERHQTADLKPTGQSFQVA